MTEDKLSQQLAQNLFNRASMYGWVGVVGVAAIIGIHVSTEAFANSLAQWLLWPTYMLTFFVVRIAHARYAQQMLQAGDPPTCHIKIEAVLCAFLGLGWGSILFVFDSSTADIYFFLRLMTISAVTVFVISATAVFLNLFVTYFAAIALPAFSFLVTCSYLPHKPLFIAVVVIYMAMMTFLARITRDRIREATIAQLAVKTLTAELHTSLEAERKLHQELSALARTDVLTGISNRRGILESLETELAKCRRLGWPLGLLMFDLDHFKNINDRFGHSAGDAALIAVVQTLQSGLRETDVLGRIGGEEFIAILPALELDACRATAERLRTAVEQINLVFEECAVPISISIGVGSYRDGEDVDRLLNRLDKSLYAAKRNGRNRVEVEAD